MKLVIGGYSQGKLNYVLQEKGAENCLVLDAELPDTEQIKEAASRGKTIVIDHFHLWVREHLLQGKDPENEVEDFLRRAPEIIVISDEIGGGIVPAGAFEREYRERTGRMLVRLAKEADEVVRVLCGIGQRIR